MPIDEIKLSESVIYIAPILLLQINIFTSSMGDSLIELMLSDAVVAVSILATFVTVANMYHSNLYKSKVSPIMPLYSIAVGYVLFLLLYVFSQVPSGSLGTVKNTWDVFIFRVLTIVITFAIGFIMYQRSKDIHMKR